MLLFSLHYSSVHRISIMILLYPCYYDCTLSSHHHYGCKCSTGKHRIPCYFCFLGSYLTILSAACEQVAAVQSKQTEQCVVNRPRCMPSTSSLTCWLKARRADRQNLQVFNDELCPSADYLTAPICQPKFASSTAKNSQSLKPIVSIQHTRAFDSWTDSESYILSRLRVCQWCGPHSCGAQGMGKTCRSDNLLESCSFRVDCKPLMDVHCKAPDSDLYILHAQHHKIHAADAKSFEVFVSRARAPKMM